jgi:hypothetical protein
MSETRYRYRYTAVMPEPAWPRGRPPRERARKRMARADLLAGLERYIRATRFLEVRPGSEASLEGIVAQWIAWAARLGAGESATAPDGSEWQIKTTWEPVW